MHDALDAQQGFGFTRGLVCRAMAMACRDGLASGVSMEEIASTLGLGTRQAKGLLAWMRLAGIIMSRTVSGGLTPLGTALASQDRDLADGVAWWVVHYQLSIGYRPWAMLAHLEFKSHPVDVISQRLTTEFPQSAERTRDNARQAIFRAIADTPIGQELGLFRLDSDGKKTTGLTKLPVRYGQAPMAAVGYAILDWARREELSSVGLTSLAAPDGPGPILHMSEGALERYLIELDGAYRGRVLTYSRTANLNEAYLRAEVTPLQVLASHYLHEQEGLDWLAALDRAIEEVPGTDDH